MPRLLQPVAPTLHRYAVDGWWVTSTLSPAELAAMSERQRQGYLRRVLRATPQPEKVEDAG